MSQTRRTQIYLTEKQHQDATRLAHQRGVSLAAVLRDALDAYLEAAADEGETRWDGDPSLDLVGALALPRLAAGTGLDEAIDHSVYDDGQEAAWSSGTVRASSPPLTYETTSTTQQRKRGTASSKRARGSSPRSSSSRKR